MGHRARRAVVFACAGLMLAGVGVGGAGAATVEVCPSGCAFSQVAPAIAAAQAGDTIRIAAGAYDGGFTIDKSVNIVGRSAAATIIRGGGPVVTVGRPGGANAGLQVSLGRVTITGGVNDTLGNAAGGGVWIPGSAGQSIGATVSIESSVVSGNEAAPKATFSDSNPGPCGVPQDECAFGSGGGISNSGTLTLTNTRVSNNVAGSPAITRYAFGGGISNSFQGTLTVLDSVVSGNRAAVSPPNGCFTEGGGIADFGTMRIGDSQITGNSSVVVSSVPSSILGNDVEQNADAGGVDLSPNATATISRSVISDNTVSDFDSAGDSQAFNGGIDNDGTLLLTDSSVDRNSVTARVPDNSGLVAAANSGGLGLSNRETVRSSHIGGNSLTAVSATGLAGASGAGIGDFSGQLTLEKTLVVGNTANASAGALTIAFGGGILETSFGGPEPSMSITDSVITANRLTGNAGAPQGGGIFNGGLLGGGPFPITVNNTVIQGNSPDQCVGC